MKFDSSDIMAILRIFNQANDDNMPRQVEAISKHKPHDKNVVIRFIFQGRRYALLIDNHAEDDEEYIFDQAQDFEAPKNYKLINNPHEDDLMAFGVPYKGKDCYLLVDEPLEKRLDLALVERLGEQSRSTYQKLILAGKVLVNNKPAISPKQLVKPGDKLSVEASQTEFEAKDFDVIYEDDNVLVINKPAGMLTHAKGVIAEEFTAADIIKPKTSYKADTNRPGIVHRLDRDTSGVLLMVKNDETAKIVQKQFSNRTVKKTYFALASGQPANPSAVIDLPIERNPSSPSTFRVGANGKPATTVYNTASTTSDQKFALIRLQPKTGRTHQLRVHLAYINAPIVGDVVYGKAKASRMFLHAESLELTLPGGERKIFSAPLPPEFDEFIKNHDQK